MAFQNASTVLSWYEHLPKEDVPPKEIWLDGKALDRHFSKITRKREGSGEAPDGTLDDAKAGHNVTLSNALVDDFYANAMSSQEEDDYSEI